MTSEVSSAHRPHPRPLSWWLVRLIVGVLAVAGVVYVGLPMITAHVLTRPPRLDVTGDPQRDEGLFYQEIIFPSRGDSISIAAWFLPNTESTRALIFVHGKGQCRSSEFNGKSLELGAALQRHGFNVLMLDLRGHGKSGDARFTFALRERRDVQGAVDWLREQGFAPGSIGVIGVSMGGATAIGAAAEDPAIGAVVSDSAYAEFEDVLIRKFPDESGLPGFMLPPTLVATRFLVGEDIVASRPIDEIDEVAPRPVLLIHAEGDELIPVEHVHRLHAAMPEAELWVVPTPEHAKTYNHAPGEYVDRVSSFFEEHLRPST